MTRIFLDANILLDVILKREPHVTYSTAVFTLDNHLKCTSSLNISNAFFMIKKNFDKHIAKANIGLLIEHCQILDVNSMMIRNAHDSLFDSFTDFEDAIQHYCAVAHSMNAIITRNEKDFRHSDLPIYSPKTFLKLFAE